MPDVPEDQMRRCKANAEGNVCRHHAGPRDVPVEPWGQASRHHVVVHDVRRHRGGGGDARDGAWRSSMRCGFEHARPPQRACVMNRVTQHGMCDVGAVMPHRTFAPRPVACRIDATGCAAGSGSRMQGNRNGGQDAGRRA